MDAVYPRNLESFARCFPAKPFGGLAKAGAHEPEIAARLDCVVVAAGDRLEAGIHDERRHQVLRRGRPVRLMVIRAELDHGIGKRQRVIGKIIIVRIERHDRIEPVGAQAEQVERIEQDDLVALGTAMRRGHRRQLGLGIDHQHRPVGQAHEVRFQ